MEPADRTPKPSAALLRESAHKTWQASPTLAACVEPNSTITAPGHGFGVGESLTLTFGRFARTKRLLRALFLWRPRQAFITAVSGNTFTVGQRRLTWAEWRAEVASAARALLP